MIRDGGIAALIPYLAVLCFVMAAVIRAAVRAMRRKPYRPPEVYGEDRAIQRWRDR